MPIPDKADERKSNVLAPPFESIRIVLDYHERAQHADYGDGLPHRVLFELV